MRVRANEYGALVVTRWTFVVATIAAASCVCVSAAGAVVRWFHSPSGNIECEVAAADPRGTYADCQTVKPPRSVKLTADGRVQVCRGVRCLGNGPTNAFTLRYGQAIRVGPFRCTSRKDGIRCVVIRSGHGFFISRERVTRF